MPKQPIVIIRGLVLTRHEYVLLLELLNERMNDDSSLFNEPYKTIYNNFKEAAEYSRPIEAPPLDLQTEKENIQSWVKPAARPQSRDLVTEEDPSTAELRRILDQVSPQVSDRTGGRDEV